MMKVRGAQDEIRRCRLGLPWPSSGLRLCRPKAEGAASIPGQVSKIPHAAQHGQNK